MYQIPEMATKFKIAHFLFCVRIGIFSFFVYLDSLHICANFHANRFIDRHQGAPMSHLCVNLLCVNFSHMIAVCF